MAALSMDRIHRNLLYNNLRLDIQVIQKTYDNALNAGDSNVYLLDGPALMALAQDDGMVDIHPNDFGFASMAKALGDVMEGIYG